MPFLFSYGTLQQDGVQLATFGRLLDGKPDAIVGYARELIRIGDPRVVALSGKEQHYIVIYTGYAQDRVEGTVYEIGEEDLERADAYEVDAYRRTLATLASGVKAWVFVDALRGPAEGGATD